MSIYTCRQARLIRQIRLVRPNVVVNRCEGARSVYTCGQARLIRLVRIVRLIRLFPLNVVVSRYEGAHILDIVFKFCEGARIDTRDDFSCARKQVARQWRPARSREYGRFISCDCRWECIGELLCEFYSHRRVYTCSSQRCNRLTAEIATRRRESKKSLLPLLS
jgi:hypothetical protein